MTESEARKLKEGDRVCWDNNPKDLGTVAAVLVCGVRIRWDSIPTQHADGDPLAFTGCGSVSLLPEAGQ